MLPSAQVLNYYFSQILTKTHITVPKGNEIQYPISFFLFFFCTDQWNRCADFARHIADKVTPDHDFLFIDDYLMKDINNESTVTGQLTRQEGTVKVHTVIIECCCVQFISTTIYQNHRITSVQILS